ncbi:bile acid-sensitive ion channel-like [Mytilus galloprovincialis]|uniref:bile acid-sensitive ion channel-like n=1 Tax=Mytilus galloprovincialis TaxID=29158 RepID=UPI003F7C5C1F
MSVIVEQNDNVLSLWKDFSQSTGFHGINKLSHSTNKLRLVIWSIILLACTTFLAIFVTTQIIDYYNYPVNTNMYTETHSEMQFPAVTICNLNSLKRNSILNDTRMENHYLKLSLLEFYATPSNWSDPFFKEQNFFENRTLTTVLKDHKIRSQVWEFHGRDLDAKEYVSFFILRSGPCLTFDPNGQITTDITGSKFNLNAWINIDAENDYFGESFGTGIKFKIHDPNEYPDFDGISEYYVEPGREISAAITKNKFEYLSKPYKAMANNYCRDKRNSDGTDYYSTHCFKDCFARHMLTSCGCVDFTTNNTLYCSKFDVENCTKDIDATARLLKSCDCPMSCKFTRYDARISSTLFPSEFYAEIFKRYFSPDLDINYYRKNYINLRIYFDQLKTVVSKQTPKYSAGEMFANLGGMMGLFLGASIVTMTELGEFVFSNLWLFITRFKTGGKTVIPIKT